MNTRTAATTGMNVRFQISIGLAPFIETAQKVLSGRPGGVPSQVGEKAPKVAQ